MRRILFAILVTLLPIAATGALAKSSARAALQVTIPEAKLTNISLGDAIDFLRDLSGVNLLVDWKALEAVNIGKDTQINLSLRGVRLEKVLSLVLNEAAPGDVLTYYIDGNIVHITTKAIADAQLIVKVYDVRDIVSLPDQYDTNISQDFGGGGGQGGSGSSSLFGSENGSSGATASQDEKARADKLIKVIETVVRPDVWKDNGGTATIEYLNGNLIISAPRSVQEAIGGPID